MNVTKTDLVWVFGIGLAVTAIVAVLLLTFGRGEAPFVYTPL